MKCAAAAEKASLFMQVKVGSFVMDGRMMDKPRLFWFAQPAPPSVLRRGRTGQAKLIDSVHMQRDGASALCIMSLLKDKYVLADVLLNLEPEVYGYAEAVCMPFDEFQPNDLILMTTRPPLNDEREFGRRAIHRTDSALEKVILKDLRRIFRHCDRQCVILEKEVIASVKKRDRGRSYRAVMFHVNRDAFVHSAADVDNPTDLEMRGQAFKKAATVAYLAYLPHIEDGGREGPGLLAVFGMNGTATLLAAHLLRSEFNGTVQKITSQNSSRLIAIKFEPELDNSGLPTTIGRIRVPKPEVVLDITGGF